MLEEQLNHDFADEDTRFDDLEFNPRLEPTKAKAWLNMLEESEKAFEPWNDHCDKIDKQYANLERLAGNFRDKEFQMFWANIEVIKPSIYAKPPQPVVVPKFKDRRPVYQEASEFLQRCAIVSFDLSNINELMLQVRDDVVITARGAAWCRYESGDDDDSYYSHEKVCIDHKPRRDFLHSVSRSWPEVTWVAAASYLTREEARDRFREHSGDEYQSAEYTVDRDAKEVGGTDDRERAKFWEIWHKPTRRVVWVAKGCENLLDEDEAHLELTGFFPCPKPAYATLQRGSLVPVPDVMQYKDQLEELNKLTGKIHALSDALEAKGFYPAGGAELGDAIETAVKSNTPGRMLVPISNWAAFGGSKEVIIWMPIEEIASTITQCIALRRQVIEDIYQIMGLSDIMRGASDARETLGAQQLKSQYGSSRVRDKSAELVRFARDLVQISADIMCEKFDPVTMIEMAQTDLPTQRMVTQQIEQLQTQLQQQQEGVQKLQQLPQAQQVMQQQPEKAQEVMGKLQHMIQTGQQALAKLQNQPTIEQVLRFLEDNRARCFVLDIETDSTILIDEQAEKQRRGEFVGVLGQLMPQLAAMVTAEPSTADFCGELLKFAVAPFRAGRSMDGSIDELVEQMKQKGSQPKGPDPVTAQSQTAKEIEQMKIAYNKERDQAEMQLKQSELQQKDAHAKLQIESDERLKQQELQGDAMADRAKAQQTGLKMMHDREKHQADQIGRQLDVQTATQKAALAQRTQMMKERDMSMRANERNAMHQQRLQQNQIRMMQPRGMQ
jgi:hypothetical protein